MIEGTLILSENAGRYVVDGDDEACELSTGMRIEIYIGNLTWIEGRVEHAGNLYATPGSAMRPKDAPPPSIGGYYFETRHGYTIGLCAGMVVRMP